MTNGHGIKVKKRSGAVEALNLDKIHKMVEEACEGLGSGVKRLSGRNELWSPVLRRD